MIIRLTQKLGKKIGVQPTRSLPLDANPYADWSARLFTADRTQFILITNTPSLYSVVTYGRGITDDNTFIQRMMNCLNEFLHDDGHAFLFERLIAPASTQIQFSKALNRSVTGSMNDLEFFAKVHLFEDDLSPHETAIRLNDMPMSTLEHYNARDEFRAMKIEE